MWTRPAVTSVAVSGGFSPLQLAQAAKSQYLAGREGDPSCSYTVKGVGELSLIKEMQKGCC